MSEPRLTYNPRSGHVKLAGAVVGRIVEDCYLPFIKGRPSLKARPLEKLLVLIRKDFTRALESPMSEGPGQPG